MKKYFTFLSLVVLCALTAVAADDGYRRTWDFTKGYSSSTLEIMAQDTELWTVQGTGYQNTKHSTTTAMMNYNGEQIPVPELEGLELGGLTSAAHVQIWDGKSNNSSFPANTACLWINGKNSNDYVSFKVPAGEPVKIGYCSHSNTQARGFSVSDGFADAEGNTKFTSMADATIVEVNLINSNAEESTLKLSSTSGHHIYYIIIGEGDEAESYNAGYLYSGSTAMEELPLYGLLKGTEGVTFTGINVDNGVPTKEELGAYDAVVLDGSLPADNAGLVALLKENLYWQPVFNVNGKLAEAIGLGTAIEMEAEIAWASNAKDAAFAEITEWYDSVKVALSGGEVMPVGLVLNGEKSVDDFLVACSVEEYEIYNDTLIAYVYNSGHNQYTYYGVSGDYGYGTESIVANLFSRTLASKSEVTATPKPAFTGDYKEMESVITLSCLNKNAAIYYTLDGTEPTTESTLYTEPLTFTEVATIKAIAVADGYLVSDVNSFEVPLYHQAKMPTISWEGNGLTENAVITIASEEEGVEIWYNFTGSEKTTESTKYDGPITLPISATIYAYAFSDSLNLVMSEMATSDVRANVEKIRRDELAHFKVSGANWNTPENGNLYLDGEAWTAWARSNYYFSWGKTAVESYENVGDPLVDENGDFIMDENGNFVYETVEKAASVTTNTSDPDWALISRGQVMIYQGNTLSTNFGNGDGYNPERAEDYLEALGTTGCIQFGGVASGDKCNASIQSTKKFAGPFNVVTIIANVASGAQLAVQVSADSTNWETIGDTLQTSTVKRLYKKFEVAYEGTDEVYVRVASVKNTSQSVHDIYVYNHGEQSEAMMQEIKEAMNIEETLAPETIAPNKPVKMIKDGRLVIVVGNAVYSVTGARLQ